MIKLSTIDERLKYGENGELRKTPLVRSTQNKEEKSLIAKHDSKYGTKKVKQQLKVMNFILK